uniref:Uncharacterized protein n=1 Tax=Acrobeloides nanus TaxID=290746 RepID=A0A914EIF9_9BILA
MAPISGTYSEAHKMGLFISMIASKTNRPAALVVLDPVDPPKIYNLELKDSGDKVLDKVILERYILHPDVERIEIETPEMTATLFRPKGQGPFPALIDMFGSSGGIKEHRAALFASHGFVTLCLPFFNYKNLPSTLADVNMEYFEYAIEFLCNLPYTTNNCGIIGRSFGSCLAMLCAQRYHKITCVINVNGSPSLEEFTTFKENGKLLPYFVPQNGYGIEHEEVVCEIDGKMAIAHNSFYKKVPENHWRLGPVENIPKNTGIYYIATLDDLGINSTETADYFYKRLKKSGHNNIVVDVKPGGHLIDAPYVPHMDFVWNKYFGIYMAYGGEPHPLIQDSAFAYTKNPI